MRPALVVAPVLGLLPLVVLASAFGGGTPAGALSCVGPTIEHTTGTLDRGATLRIEGQWWGEVGGYEDCDPDEPLDDITIVVVQGGVEHPVATVDADDDSRFVVEVPLPADLEPGLADVRAGSPMYPQSHDMSRERLYVSDAAPLPPATTTVPAAATTVPPAVEAEAAHADRNPLGVAVVVAVVGVLLVATVVLFSRQRAAP